VTERGARGALRAYARGWVAAFVLVAEAATAGSPVLFTVAPDTAEPNSIE